MSSRLVAPELDALYLDLSERCRNEFEFWFGCDPHPEWCQWKVEEFIMTLPLDADVDLRVRRGLKRDLGLWRRRKLRLLGRVSEDGADG